MPDRKAIVHERTFPEDVTPAKVAAGLSHLPGLVFLDSSTSDPFPSPSSGSRNSIIAANPVAIHSGNIHDPRARQRLRSALAEREVNDLDLGFPSGGLIGWIEYDGDFRFGEYPEMLSYDHSRNCWYEIGGLSAEYDPLVAEGIRPFSGVLAFEDSSDAGSFAGMIARAREYIAAGDIYQVNLTHRYRTGWQGSDREALGLYLRLREVSPAPFAAFLSLAGRQILSASPEQFLRISGRRIETRPIKGTRPRFADREKDEKSAYDLITSGKEIAELIMITDLERNDLGQICEFGSVEASELLKLERFAQVFHLVSTVEGMLRPGIGPVDALHACFPGGSITGAPKRRAMEIIAELETVPRGLYTGTIGCFGFNGESIFNIVIRTAICEEGTLHFHTGAGIVADSDPVKEWEETRHKASGIFQACGAETVCD